MCEAFRDIHTWGRTSSGYAGSEVPYSMVSWLLWVTSAPEVASVMVLSSVVVALSHVKVVTTLTGT